LRWAGVEWYCGLAGGDGEVDAVRCAALSGVVNHEAAIA